MIFKQLSNKLLQKAQLLVGATKSSDPFEYRPTPFLTHPFLQSVYNITQPLMPDCFERQKIFFDDGGHISLDWAKETQGEIKMQQLAQDAPILFIMHGLTGGSQMNYIKEIVKPAAAQGYRCVCLNSRGINNEMTSPIPFTAVSYGELQTAFERISYHYPKSNIFVLGTSFGGNYLMRYLIRQEVKFNIKGLIALAPPIDVRKVVDNMGDVYQQFFVKRYIKQTVLKHQQMKYWQKIGIIDLKSVTQSKNLIDFHQRVTCQILGFNSTDQLFDSYNINPHEIENLNFQTYIMLSKDDPIVSYKSMPLDSFNKNKNISVYSTQRGGHLCWFEGLKPKRWYPKPVMEFLNKLRKDAENERHI